VLDEDEELKLDEDDEGGSRKLILKNGRILASAFSD
jgi:hypothetical protein